MYDQAKGLRVLVKDRKKSLYEQKENNSKETKARTIVVTSGKGGVGKSSFSLNFAVSLSDLGYRVAILDADLGLANLDLMMGINTRYNIYHLLKGEKTLSEIMIDGPSGIKLIPGGSGITAIADLNQTSLNALIESLSVLDNVVDFLIIDTGAGINKQVLAFALSADEIIVVTTPEPTALTDSYGVIKVVTLGNPSMPIKILVNQADSAEHGRQIYQRIGAVCKKYVDKDLNLLGIVPSDINVSKAIRNQVPLVLFQPNSRSAVAIKQVARDYLLDHRIQAKKTNQSEDSKGFKGFLERMTRLLR